MLAHEEGARILLSHCSKGSASRLCGEVIYLSGYVAECALKAALFSWTPDSKHLKLVESFKKPKGAGHDLEKLRALLIRASCNFPKMATEAISLITAQWSTEMRYAGNSYRQDDAVLLYRASKVLFDWILEVQE